MTTRTGRGHCARGDHHEARLTAAIILGLASLFFAVNPAVAQNDATVTARNVVDRRLRLLSGISFNGGCGAVHESSVETRKTTRTAGDGDDQKVTFQEVVEITRPPTWTASAWLLERKYPEQYSLKHLDVTARVTNTEIVDTAPALFEGGVKGGCSADLAGNVVGQGAPWSHVQSDKASPDGSPATAPRGIAQTACRRENIVTRCAGCFCSVGRRRWAPPTGLPLPSLVEVG